MNVNNNIQFRSVEIFVKSSDEGHKILLFSYVVPVKSKVKISQNFVDFSEYMNFTPRTDDALLLRGPWNESSYFVKKIASHIEIKLDTPKRLKQYVFLLWLKVMKWHFFCYQYRGEARKEQGMNVVVKVYDMIRATTLHRDIIIDPFEWNTFFIDHCYLGSKVEIVDMSNSVLKIRFSNYFSSWISKRFLTWRSPNFTWTITLCCT